MSTATSKVMNVLQTPISRKSFLTSLGGLAIGTSAGLAGRDLLRTATQEDGLHSFAQGGEDVSAHFFFQYVGISDVSYLDIGAFDPIKINNTYFFYLRGNRGVLVEPNIVMCKKLREVRPKDTTLAAGIGVTSVRDADYFLMTDPAWNTFSREEAEHMERSTNRSIRIKKTVKMPLLNINDVMEKHFQGAPTFLSIDAEGLHLAILKSIDFDRYRPPLICAETLISGGHGTISEIPDFMATKGYVARGGSFANTLFVDSKYG